MKLLITVSKTSRQMRKLNLEIELNEHNRTDIFNTACQILLVDPTNLKEFRHYVLI